MRYFHKKIHFVETLHTKKIPRNIAIHIGLQGTRNKNLVYIFSGDIKALIKKKLDCMPFFTTCFIRMEKTS